MRIGCDTGGTFTDLVTISDGRHNFYKSPTRPANPTEGILNVLAFAAQDNGTDLASFLGRAELFVHGTTHPLNAVLTGHHARIALVVTRGHRDILLLREGGRADPFDKKTPFPRPFVPRHLTFELDERILYDGSVELSPSPESLDGLVAFLRDADVEAVAVCLLWSIRNPSHEKMVRERLEQAFPGLPVSLSSEVNPIIREFRRASSTAIDASLKPLTTSYVAGLKQTLRDAGLTCPFFLVASDGSLIEPEQAAARPVSLINSGPSMAPMGAQHAGGGATDLPADMIICDAGGTTFDVSIVAGGVTKTSTENWVGDPADRLFCGFPSVEVLSIGAGGGSIASVDAHGLLRVGPQSAGAIPGPVCYGAGGTEPTFTDSALLRGIINPKGLLGGKLPLDADSARQAMQSHIAGPLGLSVDQALLKITALMTDKMAHAIEEAVQKHGLSPTECTLVGAGGAAGFNIVDIAERLGCGHVHVPGAAPVLSAFGMGIARPFAEVRAVLPVTSRRFDRNAVESLLARLRAEALDSLPAQFRAADGIVFDAVVEARYDGQVWEIDVPFDPGRTGPDLGHQLAAAFHKCHEDVFRHADPALGIEFITWRLRASLPGQQQPASRETRASDTPLTAEGHRRVLHASGEWIDVPVHDVTDLAGRLEGVGPAIVESTYNTIYIGNPHRFVVSDGGIVVTVARSAEE